VPDAAATVAELLLRRRDDDAPGLRFGGRGWSWAEVVRESAARAARLGELLEGGEAPHVGILLDNTPEYLFWLGAAALHGAVVVGVNPTRRGRELEADIRFTRCRALVTDTAGAALLAGLDIGVDPARLLVLDDPATTTPVTSWETDAVSRLAGHVGVSPGDLFLLLFTSGTTGSPKAVRCTQGRLAVIAARAAALYDFRRDDVCYCPMPLFHGNAVMALWAPALAVGASVALAGRFSASSFVDDVRTLGATRFTYVGKALAYVLATPERPDDHEQALRIGFGTEASALDRRAFERRFGCTLVEGYGSSEGGVTINVTPETPPGSLGLPAPGQDVVVVGPDGTERPRARLDASGRLQNGEEAIGELVNRSGAPGFEGYYDNDAAEGERTRDGWYWSGDLGYRDEVGYFYFAGRSGDWLRVDSENFAAAPVERVLERHPDVAAAAVYPVPDPVSGDTVMAAVELVAGAHLDPDAFAAWLARQPDLGTKWAPRLLRVTPALPLTATGKVTKTGLRQRAWECEDPVWWSEGRSLRYRLLAPADRAQLRRQMTRHGRGQLLGARRCVVVQHVEPEGPGALEAVLQEAGVAVERCRLFAGDTLPADPAALAGLVVMGGPMSATSDEGFSWRRAELDLLVGAATAGTPVLGVCLGAQLLALAAGGRVRRGEAGIEIGWGEIALTEEAKHDPLFHELPATMGVLHWHGDTIDLPPAGTLLASSSRYPAQAFRLGPSAWGLQFHVEVDDEGAARMAQAFPEDAALAPGGAAGIGEGGAGSPDAPGRRVLERFAAVVAAGDAKAAWGSRRTAADVL
jgi:fatty-acyl-CoA synthase